MRCLKAVAPLVLLAGGWFTASGTAWADNPPPCPPEGCGRDGGRDAGSGLKPGGDGADVWAENGSDLGDPSQPRSGGGDVVCQLVAAGPGAGGTVGWKEIDWAFLSSPPPELVGSTVTLLRTCSDGTNQLVTLTLPVSAPPAADPQQLALLARRQLPFPLPAPGSAPPADRVVVQLPTYLWIDNWVGASRTASAGNVSATVTATPLRQEWLVHDELRGFDTERDRVVCANPGSRFDPSVPYEAQSPACGWTPRHSSAGQPQVLADGTPCFAVDVTVWWAVTWTSNIGAGGSLGEVPRTARLCVAVMEIQAIGTKGDS